MKLPNLIHLGKRPTTKPSSDGVARNKPDWQQADPAFIERALQRAQTRPSGGWFVLGETPKKEDGPTRYEANGEEFVAWHADSKILVAPASCPHMGADLSCGHVQDGKIVCPWHGLALGKEGQGRWQPVKSFDDGVLLWIRLPEAGEEPTDTPILAPRPTDFLSAVISMEAKCDPQDVVANRLDPWHGAHYHPHSFAALTVLDQNEDALTLRVSFRVLKRFAVEVDCTFHSPEPRTITMTIIDGEGIGSVVETHGTPLAPGRTQVIEATLATSDRLLDRFSSRLAGPFTKITQQLMERRAQRLWVEDIAYAERRYALRARG